LRPITADSGTNLALVPNRYESTSQRLDAVAEQLRQGLRELLVERSSLRRRQQMEGVVVLAAPYLWQPLDDDGRALQARLRRVHSQFSDVVNALLRLEPERTQRKLAKMTTTITEAIEQNRGSHKPTTEQAFAVADEALAARLKLVHDLYDPAAGSVVFSPDANAVVWNDNLEEWSFPDVERFTLVLTSTLLSELDDLKMRDRNEGVRDAAERAIRRIKEFMRRGEIHDGVTLTGKNRVRLVAVEPDFDATLPWLDPTVKDDRLIASTLELAREYVHSAVVLVTRDVNMQNKAVHASLVYVEPPDPLKPRAAKKPPKADVRIVGFNDGDGSERAISFRVNVQNFETRPVLASVTASLDGEPLTDIHPVELNLLANATPTTVSVHVPRPQLADKVKALNDETTLYGRTLKVVISVDGRAVASREWSEIVYGEQENAERSEIQRRVWRIGRDEASDADHEAQFRLDVISRMSERDADLDPTDDLQW
jgi:hypothetical protein